MAAPQPNKKSKAKTFSSVDNLDNTISFGSADDAIKCIYFAFGYAQSLTPDQVYEKNEDLLSDTCHWDDSEMAWKLGKRYGFAPHLTLVKVRDLAGTFKDATKDMVVLYELSGKKIPANLLDKVLTEQNIENLLTDKAYEDIGLHAMYGSFSKSTLGFKDQNGTHNPLNKAAYCVVFIRTKPVSK